MTNTEEIYIAQWNESKWLTASSLLFLISSMYAYYNELFFYSTFLFFTSTIRANYWRKATYSWRRNLDLFYAKLSIAVFVYNGIVHIKYNNNNFIIIGGYCCLLVLPYTFYLSEKLHRGNNPLWYKWHILFHLLLTFEQFVVLNSIIKYEQQQKLF